jgi:erythromycin esterase-like protein
LGLFCLILIWDTYDNSFFSCRDIEEIAQHAIPIQSIHPNDTDYTDLLFLKDILEGKRIVLLGEPTHFDASVFLGKTRLIKFLHEKLGYNVLVWEAGLYDIWYINQYTISNGRNYSWGVFSLWSDVEETKPLWHYLNQQKLSIALRGIDLQLSGAIPDSLRTGVLKNYLVSKNINMTDYPVFSSILQDMTLNFFYSQYRIRPNQGDSLVEEMEQIVETIQNQRDLNEIDSVYIQYLGGLALWVQTVTKYPLGNPARNGIRDSMMMENFMKYSHLDNPNEKIIIWCSNFHLLHNHYAYVLKGGDTSLNFISLGEHLKNKYKDSVYGIAFTWFCKQTKENHIINKASSKNIEYALHQKGVRYAFIDFSQDSLGYLQKEFKSKANHGNDILGFWHKMTDAFFFIDTTRMSTNIKNNKR